MKEASTKIQWHRHALLLSQSADSVSVAEFQVLHVVELILASTFTLIFYQIKPYSALTRCIRLRILGLRTVEIKQMKLLSYINIYTVTHNAEVDINAICGLANSNMQLCMWLVS